MRVKSRAFWAVLVLLASGGGYVTWAAIRAHSNLVTLNVRDMEVRKVLGKIEWQTRETIVPDKNVKGKVTLNVKNVPLEEVLRIIGEQTSSRVSTFYPLYSSSKSMSMLQRALRGELEANFAGWTNLQRRGFGGGGPGGPGGFGGGPGSGRGGGMFGMPRTNQPSVISLDIRGKDVQFAATALSRFGGVRVVPDDALHKTINLKLDQVRIEDAIGRLAKTASAKWDKIYSLQGDEGPRQFADRRGGGFRDLSDEEREELRKQREAMEEELKQALSAEERAKLEEERRERERMMQEIQSLTPDQRRERFQAMGGAMREQRNLDRIKNTTPEQRVDRYRQMNERRKRWQDGGGRGGPGGGGGPGGPGGGGPAGPAGPGAPGAPPPR